MDNHALNLNNGTQIPIVGFGTWQIPEGPEAIDITLAALETGYRHIDTAKIYGNEKSVGEAIRRSGIPREEMFVTTKLWTTDVSDPGKALEDSLARLGLEYIDLYLVHWPVPGREMEVWADMEPLVGEGLAKSIGVSNYNQDQIQQILASASIPPAVNQIEASPFIYPQGLIQYCQDKGIVVEAYSPLARGSNHDDPELLDIAKTASHTPAQVMLRWAVQHGMVVLPKTATPSRLKENLDIFGFELDGELMRRLDELSAR